MIKKAQFLNKNIRLLLLVLITMIGIIFWCWPKRVEINETNNISEEIQAQSQEQLNIKEDFFKLDTVNQLITWICKNHNTKNSNKIENESIKIIISPIRDKVIFLGKDYSRFNQYSGVDCSISVQNDSITIISKIKREEGNDYMALPIDIIYSLLINNKQINN